MPAFPSTFIAARCNSSTTSRATSMIPSTPPFSIAGSLTAAGKWILGRGRGVVPGGLVGNVTSQRCEARLVGQHALVFS